MKKLNSILVGILGILLFIAMGAISQDDYEQSLRDEALYGELVCSDVWPDFRGLEPDCELIIRNSNETASLGSRD